MIADPERLSLSVTVDDSVVDAHISVSLGLIVTELVINALKHAFPDERGGSILVDYSSSGSNWMLSIRDDGVGIASGDLAPRSGLGTGIVEALARNLDARVELLDVPSRTHVRIGHTDGSDPQTAGAAAL